LKQFNGYFAAKLRKNPNISKYLACFVVFAYIFGIVSGGFDISYIKPSTHDSFLPYPTQRYEFSKKRQNESQKKFP
jgi:hypothetical protein